MQLDLHADLAVLSACETARGRIGAEERISTDLQAESAVTLTVEIHAAN